MLEPFFNPDGSPNVVACLEQLNLIALVYQDNRSACEQYLAEHDGGTIVYWNAPPGTIEPQSCIIQHGPKDFWVVVAGTTNWRQWIGNAWGTFGEPYDVDPRMTVHSFFLKERNRLWDAYLQSEIPSNLSGVKVRFSGHSLGGAVSELLAYKLDHETGGAVATELLTFAAPKPLTKPTSMGSNTMRARITHAGDVVPFTPPVSALLFLASFRNVGFLLPTAYDWEHPIERHRIDRSGSFQLAGKPENEVFEFNYPASSNYLADHIWPTYITSLAEASYKLPQGALTVQQRARIASAVGTAGGQVPANFLPLPLPSTFTTPAKLNQGLTGSAIGPVTPDNINASAGVTAFGSNIRVPTRNIAGSPALGGNMPRSAYTKVSLIVNNGQSGVSHSFVTDQNSSSDFKQVMASAIQLAFDYSKCFGCDNGSPTVFPVKSLGAPCVEFLRLSDPLSPRLGVLVPLNITKSANYFGYGTTAADAADRLSTTLSLRMQGVDGAGHIGYANFIMCGQPDGVVLQGRYNPDFVYSSFATKTYDTLLRELLQKIVAAGWGFMGRDWSEADKNTTVIALNGDDYPVLTVPGHGYSSNDIIVIKGTDKPGLPKKARIRVIDANSFALTRKFDLNLPTPDHATVFRVRLADGTRKLSFYRFQTRPEGFLNPLQVQVRSHRPGRQFVAVSFSKRGTRVKI